jgi:hypothetical protein
MTSGEAKKKRLMCGSKVEAYDLNRNDAFAESYLVEWTAGASIKQDVKMKRSRIFRTNAKGI